jgi:cell shape-determining protein MreC
MRDIKKDFFICVALLVVTLLINLTPFQRQYNAWLLNDNFRSDYKDPIKSTSQLTQERIMCPIMTTHVLSKNITVKDHLLYIRTQQMESPDYPLKRHQPVLHNNMLIGFIDVVSDEITTVRLLTDPKSHVSVRAIRGSVQDAALVDRLSEIKEWYQYTISSDNGQNPLVVEYIGKSIAQLIKNESIPTMNLALGVTVQYGVLTTDRLYIEKMNQIYSGIDKQLSSVSHYLKDVHKSKYVQPGDAVITSGDDGIFPEGLMVGYVEKTNATNTRVELKLLGKSIPIHTVDVLLT